MTALLEARRVGGGYGGRAALREASLSIARGECVAITGPNAAGKSTLLRALCGALPDATGEIRLDGTELSSLSSIERARRVALVPQASRWDLDFTVRELVAMGRAPHTGTWGLETARDREIIAEAMTDADVAPLAERRFAELSGGERQRVLLARALAQSTPLLLLDEPTAHLDPGHQQLVLDRLLAHAARGGASVTVLHDLALASRLHRVVVLEAGRIVADGPAAMVLTPDRLAATWGIDAELVWSAGAPAIAVRGRATR